MATTSKDNETEDYMSEKFVVDTKKVQKIPHTGRKIYKFLGKDNFT
jgi:ribosomal protein S5